MENSLRPMTLGELLDRTAELYRTHFQLFAGISALFATAMLFTQLLQLGTMKLIGYPNIPADRQWIYAVSLVAEVLVYVLVAGLIISAFNRVVAWIHLAEPVTIHAAVASIRSRWQRYIWLMTVTSFRAWAPLAILYVVLFGILVTALPKGALLNPQLMQQGAPPDPQTLITAGISLLVLLPLLLVAFIYGVFMWLRYSLAMPACVVENLTARQAIGRGIELSKGSRGRIFVLWLMVYAIRMLIGILMAIPIVFFTFKHLGQQMPLGMIFFTALGGFVTNTLIGPIYSTGLTLFYYDLRIRKEGFDIEWMMRAAGLTPQPELPTAVPSYGSGTEK